ncbi:MAG: tetratricopeptide repeat protein [Candidatus Riflebacteria bacterium]|nr:tetratricopeptide repeat protein [Candidatus Riflebacteria bacterium]
MLAAASGSAADYFEARAYFRQGKYQKAIEVLDGIKSPPPELLLMRAECLENLERLPEAIAVLRAFPDQFPGSASIERSRLKLIDLLRKTRDYTGLVDVLEKALAEDSGRDSPHVKDLALAYVRAGQPAKAIGLLEGRPTSRNLALLADVLRESNLLASFLTDRERTFSGDLEKARILGLLFAAAQDWPKARQYLSMAAPVEDTVLKLAEVLRVLNDCQGLIVAYEKLVALAPTRGTHYEKLGEAYQAAGDPAKALSTWRRILVTQGSSAESFGWLARVLAAHSFHKEALEAMRQARRDLNDPALFHKEMAESHVALGDADAASREYLELAPSNFEAVREPLVTLARSSEAAYRVVATRLEAAVTASPRLPEYYLLADEVLRIRGFGPEVQALIDRMCQAFQTVPRELLLFVGEFNAGGKRPEALRMLDFLVAQTRDADLWESLLAQADCLRAESRPLEALAGLERLRGLNPGAGFLTRSESLRGTILLEDLKRHAEARAVFDALVMTLPAAPEVPSWQLSSARAAMALLDLETARKLLVKLATHARPDMRQAAALELGRTAMLEGRFEDAMEAFSSITMEDTGSQAANDAMEDVLFLTTHPAGPDDREFLKKYCLLRHFQQAGLTARYAELAPTVDPAKIPPMLAADFLWLQARAERAQGRFDAAVQSLQTLTAKFADSPLAPRALLELADLQELDLKNREEAAKALKSYLFACPDSLMLDDIRTRIERLDNPKS